MEFLPRLAAYTAGKMMAKQAIYLPHVEWILPKILVHNSDNSIFIEHPVYRRWHFL
jgi:hypothetical protein